MVNYRKWLNSCTVPDVPDDEDEVEPGKDGGHEVDVLRRALEVVVAPVDGVGSGQHRRTAISSFHHLIGRHGSPWHTRSFWPADMEARETRGTREARETRC